MQLQCVVTDVLRLPVVRGSELWCPEGSLQTYTHTRLFISLWKSSISL
jgi:hypothetical protein